MHHYPHHIGDYRTHTAHLTMVEDGAYRRLIDVYYMHEKPLPAEIAAVQRLASARTKEERAAVEAVLREFFSLQADGWHQGRCDEEIAAYRERAEKARTNGKNGGGRPRKTKPRDNPEHKLEVTQSKPSGNPPGYFWVSKNGENTPEKKPSGKLTGNHESDSESGAPPKGRPPDSDSEIHKPSPVAAREDGPEGAGAHDVVGIIRMLSEKKRMTNG